MAEDEKLHLRNEEDILQDSRIKSQSFVASKVQPNDETFHQTSNSNLLHKKSSVDVTLSDIYTRTDSPSDSTLKYFNQFIAAASVQDQRNRDISNNCEVPNHTNHISVDCKALSAPNNLPLTTQHCITVLNTARDQTIMKQNEQGCIELVYKSTNFDCASVSQTNSGHVVTSQQHLPGVRPAKVSRIPHRNAGLTEVRSVTHRDGEDTVLHETANKRFVNRRSFGRTSPLDKGEKRERMMELAQIELRNEHDNVDNQENDVTALNKKRQYWQTPPSIVQLQVGNSECGNRVCAVTSDLDQKEQSNKEEKGTKIVCKESLLDSASVTPNLPKPVKSRKSDILWCSSKSSRHRRESKTCTVQGSATSRRIFENSVLPCKFRPVQNKSLYNSALNLNERGLGSKYGPIAGDRSYGSVKTRSDLSASQCQINQQKVVKQQASSAHLNQTPEKKRLCKSLCNLTADDVLSIPCSSIFDRTSPPISPVVSKKQTQIAKLITDSPLRSIQKSPYLIMPSHSNESNGRKTVFNRKTDQRDFNPTEVNEKTSKGKDDILPSSNSVLSQQKHLNENKSENPQKVPKLTKSLFPFMWKSRKRQNSSTITRGKPLKAQTRDDLKSSEISKQNKLDKTLNAEMNTNVISKVSQPLVIEEARNEQTMTDAVGFTKLKVVSKQEQRNVHADYATRVTRVRRSSWSSEKGSSNQFYGINETHLTSLEPTDDTRHVIFRNRIRPRRDSARRSVDFPLNSSASHHLCRPYSYASPGIDSRPRNDLLTGSSVDISCFTADQTANLPEPTLMEIETTSSRRESSTSSFGKARPSSTALHEEELNEAKLSLIQQVENARCSLNLDLLKNTAFDQQLSCLTSLAVPQTRITGSKSGGNLNELTTGYPLLASSHLSVAASSLASSYGSIDVDDPDCDQEKVKSLYLSVEKVNQTESENSSLTGAEISNGDVATTEPAPLRKTSSSLQMAVKHKRSLSPNLRGDVFKSGFRYDDKHSFKNRNQSLKDLSSYRKPNKPNTPKPRKISFSNSTSSINNVGFRFSSQNLNLTMTDPNSIQTVPNIADANVVRSARSSAKNASIRRRMSLQSFKPLTLVDVTDDDNKQQKIQPSKNISDWKRHSISGVDIEQMAHIVRWNVSLPNGMGATATAKRARRKQIRPVSEIPNLRWEVEAIPEHREVSNNQELESPKAAVVAKDFPPPSNVEAENCMPLKDATHNKVFPRLLHCDASCAFRLGVLGTCFSEENLSTITEEEMSDGRGLLRSLSAIGGLNTMPESLMRFYPPKYFWHVSPRVSFNSTSTSCQFSPLGYDLPERSHGEGSTMSAISNESGYGTMTRKNTTLRRSDVEDEEVFSHQNTSKLSSEDFASDDGVFVEALWDHVTMDADELGFKVGEVIRVIDLSNADWWWGALESREGWFPATFVRILVNQHRDDTDNSDMNGIPSEDDTVSIASHEYTRVTCFGDECCRCAAPGETNSMSCEICRKPYSSSTKRISMSNHNQPSIVVIPPPSTAAQDRIRKNVINEIVNSEKVFVGHLKDVIEGYLTRCRKRVDMFTEEQISTMFSNIEEIYEFQQKFAAELEAAVDRASVHSSQLGNVFLNHKSGFTIYSEYCNRHPQALSLLSEMLGMKKYMHFFEACRLLQRMIDISLDGFLLTPVQKICKYPLQLAELLKYTSPDHPDYEPVKSALNTMKGVAKMINERKRKMENFIKISLWQNSISSWQGDDVLMKSSELVHSGEVFTNSKNKAKLKNRMAFLFDHQLILCKKDLLRRDLLYYKSRVDLDRCIITPLEEESPRNSSSSGEWTSTGSVNTQLGWKITERDSGESGIMCCRNDDEMSKWMKAFTLEREITLKKESDVTINESVTKSVLANSLYLARKPKGYNTSTRLPASYRYRAKTAREFTYSMKNKNTTPTEKSGKFFSNVAVKLSPFRRTVRENTFVF